MRTRWAATIATITLAAACASSTPSMRGHGTTTVDASSTSDGPQTTPPSATAEKPRSGTTAAGASPTSAATTPGSPTPGSPTSGSGGPGATAAVGRRYRVVETTRHDRLAGTAITTTLFVPSVRSATRFPLVVWSHGLHATPKYFATMLRAWTTHGYIVAAPQFPGTAGSSGKFANYIAQPAIVRALLDVLTRAATTLTPASGAMVAPDRVAVAGHSLGAVTALALVGQSCCRDDRIGAVVLVDGSDQPFAGSTLAHDISVPVLLIHGQRDTTFPVADAEALYTHFGGRRALVVLGGAPHTAFRGAFGERIRDLAITFLDDVVLADPSAAAEFARLARPTAPGDRLLEP